MWRDIFRTYLKGDGKKCIDSHKNHQDVRTWDGVQGFDSFGAVLLPEYVDISFDDAKMSENFLELAEEKGWQCIALKNPVNGHLHTYWKDTKKVFQKYRKDQNLVCGLIADVHGGETYIPLRVYGVDRYPPEYDLLEGEECQEVPVELQPINTKIKLWGLKEGDGRNDSLFRYILTLRSQTNMTEEEITAMYHNVINKHILSEPVETDELEVILRKDAFPADLMPMFFTDKGHFKHYEFARYMRDIVHVIQIRGQLHIYNGSVYMPGWKCIESKMAELIEALTDRQRKEVIKQLLLITTEQQPMPAGYIAVGNGVLNLTAEEDAILEFSPIMPITNQLQWNYMPGCYNGLMDKTLDKICCNDPDVRRLILEMIGYCLYQSNSFQKAFVLIGDGANGKSVLLKCIKALLGEQNYSALDLSETGDRFSTAMLFGKLANIGDDISDEFLCGNASALFKKIVTGDTIKAENKGQDPFMFAPFCKLIFSANEMPRSKDRTGAIQRRLVMIPFRARFTPDDPDFDPMITNKLLQREPLEYLLAQSVKAFREVLKRGRFTQPEAVEKEEADYELVNNPIKGFIAEIGEAQILNQLTGSVFQRYVHYTEEAQLGRPMSKVGFSRAICKELNCETRQTRNEKQEWVRVFSPL